MDPHQIGNEQKRRCVGPELPGHLDVYGWTMTTPDPRCERCDLPLAQCEHGSRAAKTERQFGPDRLEISPRKMAHLPGCLHNDDSDFTSWGFITHEPAAAWRRLGNGTPVPADSGNRPDLVAEVRCSTCVESEGPG